MTNAEQANIIVAKAIVKIQINKLEEILNGDKPLLLLECSINQLIEAKKELDTIEIK